MRRAAFILLMILAGSLRTAAQTDDLPRFTFGAEWGYIGIFYSGHHNNFYALEGFRVDSRGHEFRYADNAEAYIHAGCNISSRYNMSVYIGFSAIEDMHHTIPMSLRLTRYYGEDHLKDRMFAFIDLGSGISIKENPQEILTGKLGGGYRISLSRNAKLDLVASYRAVLTHPDIEYYNMKIAHENINRNNTYLSAISLGISITF